MVGALVVIIVLGSVLLAATAYMEWIGVLSLFSGHGTLREIVVHPPPGHHTSI